MQSVVNTIHNKMQLSDFAYCNTVPGNLDVFQMFTRVHI